MSSTNKPRRGLMAALAALAIVALMSGCAIHPSEETSVGTEAEADLEARVLAATDIANGVFVSKTSSGLGNDVIQVRLYVDKDDLASLTTAVDGALETTWQSWPKEPSVVSLELVVGPKPADAGTADVNIRDLEDVAAELDIPTRAVRVNINLTAPDLVKLYGPRADSTNG